MVAFIDAHRETYGVEPICEVLPIASSSYYEQKARERDPARQPARWHRDVDLRREIQRVWDANVQVYGVCKVWRQLVREGIVVARCTVARLMRELGLAGAVRGRAWKVTTVAEPDAPRPTDLVAREFRAERPNALWVSDLTYVAAWRGFVYVAFVIDVFARRLWAGGCRAPSAVTLPWTRSSKRSMIARRTPASGWCITAIAACSTCPFGTRSGWRRPGSNARLGVAGTHMTTPSRNP